MSGAVGHDSALSERYAIERELGRGGMGVVFLARDVRHDRRVAIKFLPADLASAVGAGRFTREIRTLARLSHPHILPLHDSGEADGELYYVMPHVEGESLRQRLEREGPLRLGQALRIARQVADALAYAHARGIVHRDIKPENILLDRQGHAYVADFGIARVLQTTDDGSGLTSMAVRVGSPAYMSPEQVAGERELDGRSDLYSLGCVLFEMLAGEPPFADRSAQVVMRRHLIEAPPRIRDRRADAPSSADDVLAAMLAKSPDERIASAEVLCAALDSEIAQLTGEGTAPRLIRTSPPRWWRRVAIGSVAAAAAIATMLWGVGLDATGIAPPWASPPDSTRWLVLPLQWAEGSEPSSDRHEDLQLYAAFDRWDLGLIDRLTVEEAVDAQGGRQALTASVGLGLARHLDAGRLVHGLAERVGDSIQIELTLSDAARDRSLGRVSVRVPTRHAGRSYAIAADSLLFGRVSWGEGPESDIGTSSAAARRAYGRAMAALDAWDIQRADSSLRAALEHDDGFGRASLWLAQIAAWSSEPPEAWLPPARLAVSRSADLTEREAVLARGLVAMAEGRYPDACQGYTSLLERDERDHSAWLGLAFCNMTDLLVVPDRMSPSGWRFRASYHRGLEALRRAFELEPGGHRLFLDGSFLRLRDGVFFTRRNMRRSGDSNTGLTFAARPQWQGDSILFVPYPWQAGQPYPRTPLDGVEEALTQQRLAFREVTRGWSRAFPESPEVMHAVALSLEMLNDPAALDTLLRVRRLGPSPGQRLELAIQEVWLRVKLSAGSPESLASARMLADSVLRSRAASDPAVAPRLAALAVLIGRPAAGAAFARRSPRAVLGSDLAGSVTTPAAALLVFSAVGTPRDSIAYLERFTESAIRNTLDPAQRSAARMGMLERPAILAHDALVFELLRDTAALHTRQAQVLRAFYSQAAPDTVAALRLVSGRRGGTPDMAFPTAALAAIAGDTAGAIAILETVLEEVRWLQPGLIEDIAHAGAIVRAMALRAELAARTGDPAVARAWGRAVHSLWADGEASVAPIVERMRSISTAHDLQASSNPEGT